MIGSFELDGIEKTLSELYQDDPFYLENSATVRQWAKQICAGARCRYLVKKCLVRPAENGIKAAGTELIITGPITENVLGQCTNLSLICAVFDTAGDTLVKNAAGDVQQKAAAFGASASLRSFVEKQVQQIETEASWEEKHVLGVFYFGDNQLDPALFEPVLTALEADKKLKITRDDQNQPVNCVAAVIGVAPDKGASKATCKGCPGCGIAKICRFNNIVVAEEKKAAKAAQAAT